MDLFSVWHWLIVAVIVMLLFGRGKISDVMGDVAYGIKAFKKGMAEDSGTTPAKSEAPTAVEGSHRGELPASEAAHPTERAHTQEAPSP